MPHNIEDIIPPSQRKSFSARSRNVAEKTGEFLSEKRRNVSHKQLRKKKSAYAPAIIAFGVIVISVGVLLFFSGAQVEIIPRTNTTPLSAKFTATASTTGILPFSLISIDKRAVQYVVASSTKANTSVATGEITIYNTRASSLRLVIKTRFKTLGGLVFYLRKPVIIPAKRGVVPGTITVAVYASEPGSKYNIKPSFFSVPGFARTSLANKIYAKSTRPITGGASGVIPVIPDREKSQVRETLQKALEKSLLKDVSSKVPAKYTLLSNAVSTTYTALPDVIATSTNSNKVGVQEEATITAVIFLSTSLAKNITSNLVPTYDGIAPVYIKNPQVLTLTPLSTFPNIKTKSFRFMLSGQVTIVWSVDKARIASAITGKTHEEAKTIIGALPSVKKAYLVLRPFWLNTFPKDPSKIDVTISQP